jgi:PST family polysaccharide transporter
VHGAGLTALGYVATQGMTLVAYAVLARLATPSEFGTFTAAAILITAGLFFAESGMTAAIVRWQGDIDAVAATAFVSTLAGGTLLTLMSLALSPIVGVFFRSSEIGVLAAALSAMFLVHAASVVPNALLRRRLSTRPVLLVEPVAAITMGVAGGVALAMGLGVWGLAVGAYASAVVRTILMWSVGGWWPRIRGASLEIWKELARYARQIVAGETVRQATTIVTTALTGRVLGPASLGQFRYGYRMATAGAGLTGAGAYVLLPTFSRLASDRERLRSAYVRALHVASVVLFPLGLLLGALGEPIAVFLFGEPWAEAGWVFTALAGLMVVSGPGSVAAEFLKATGRPGILAQAHVLTAVISISLVAAFVSVGPVLVGAAITLGAAAGTLYIIVRAASIVGASRRSVFGSMAAPFTCGLLAAGLVFALDRFVLDAGGATGLVSLVILASELALGAVCYLGVLIAVSPRALGELRAVRDTVGARRRRS